MNKLLIFPMAFMLILTIFGSVFSNYHPTGTTGDYSNQSGAVVQGENATVDIPSGDSETVNIWTTAGAMVILILAISIGVIAGIKILGSGLSDMSQNLIFNGILFLGLWACLSAISAVFLFDTSISTLLWIFLTTIYIIGMGIHLNGSGATS